MKIGRYILIVGLLLAGPWSGHTQHTEEDQHGFTSMKQAGQLFTLELTPRDKKVRLKVAGQKSAEIDLDNLDVQASWIFGEQEKPLKVVPSGGFFLVHTDDPKLKAIKVKVRDKEKDAEETFEVKLPQK